MAALGHQARHRPALGIRAVVPLLWIHAVTSEQGHVHGRYDLKLSIPTEHQGKLWLYTGGSLGKSDGISLTGDVLPVMAFSPGQFFVPKRLQAKVR